jgi:hypothetical protein
MSFLAVSMGALSDQTRGWNLQDQYQIVMSELTRLSEVEFDPGVRDARRCELQTELSQLEDKLAEHVELMAQTIRERNLTLTDIARNLPPQSALMDFIQYRRLDFAAKTNQWKEQRYAAYLTFPLARDSTNVVVERVDLGEAAPINESIALSLQTNVRWAIRRQGFVRRIAEVEPVGLCPARAASDECFAPDCLPGRTIEPPAIRGTSVRAKRK